MKLKCIWVDSGSLNFTIGKIYKVINVEKTLDKEYYTIHTDSGIPVYVPLLGSLYNFELIEEKLIPRGLKRLKKGDYAKYIGDFPSYKNFIKGNLYQLTRDYDNGVSQFIDERGIPNGWFSKNEKYFVVPTKEELKEKLIKSNNNMKISKGVINKVSVLSGYSASHIRNVISGRRTNHEILAMVDMFNLSTNGSKVTEILSAQEPIKKEKNVKPTSPKNTVNNKSSEVTRRESSIKEVDPEFQKSFPGTLGLTKEKLQNLVEITTEIIKDLPDSVSKTYELFSKKVLNKTVLTEEEKYFIYAIASFTKILESEEVQEMIALKGLLKHFERISKQ